MNNFNKSSTIYKGKLIGKKNIQLIESQNRQSKTQKQKVSLKMAERDLKANMCIHCEVKSICKMEYKLDIFQKPYYI